MPREKSRQDVSRWGSAVPSDRLVEMAISIKAVVISLKLSLSREFSVVIASIAALGEIQEFKLNLAIQTTPHEHRFQPASPRDPDTSSRNIKFELQMVIFQLLQGVPTGSADCTVPYSQRLHIA
jgi:hypothetical protein